jgi:hypothetical protein
LGTVYILPAAPLGTTDQMSPTRAAVPHSLPDADDKNLNALDRITRRSHTERA